MTRVQTESFSIFADGFGAGAVQDMENSLGQGEMRLARGP